MQGVRAAAAKALASICTRAKDKPACAVAVLEVWKSTRQTPARCALLGLLPGVPVQEPLAAVRTATGGADPQVRDAAAGAMAEWPSAEVLEDLLKVAATGSDTHKVLAVRGCVRLLGLPADRSPEKTAGLYARLLKLARRPQERRVILAGLATLISLGKQEAMLEFGSDDGIKAWLGGKLVHANNASRSLKPGEDKVKVTLRPGRNVLMLKINNGSTDWGACARITGLDAKPVRGLRVVAE